MRLHVPIRLRWSDLDAYGHVNNAEMLRLLEEARILAFWADDAAPDDAAPDDAAPDAGHVTGAVGASTAVLDGRPGASTLTLIGRQEIEYLAPVPYLRAPLDIQLWLGRMGGASLEVCYEVWSPESAAEPTLYARAATTIVLVDSVSGSPRRISEIERAAWTPYLDEPVRFSKRR
ncbi:acyl-CoA thioesterase [Microterricola viridarii]|uniref:4-hydroxybenzoyl-CoA thioesterase n=1 Tax=Microterricola viridarii TaxID=412690 RepID=A0A109QWR2_9MICO|nr:thioesterase family protein [Microterricola viridarii]AMB58264.1 4-hydroxybenzoyl-CoA thioesterase [Microterricola viridarii]